VAIYAGEFSAKLRGLDREFPIEEAKGFEDLRVESKKGNPRRLLKRERKRRERLKKL
jgi:hypothetical protein